MSPLEYNLKLVHTIVIIITNISRHLLITTQVFVISIWGLLQPSGNTYVQYYVLP